MSSTQPQGSPGEQQPPHDQPPGQAQGHAQGQGGQYGAQPAYAAAGQYGPTPPGQRTNVMAIVSIASSILGITLLPVIGSIVGVVTGHIARKQIAETGEQGAGAATAGLAIGYIVIGLAVLAVVVGIVALVVFASAATALA